MPRGRVQIGQIESYQPAIDYRKTNRVGVISGRNFSWDAAGVRSDFAYRLATDLPYTRYAKNLVAQSVKVGTDYVLLLDGYRRFTPDYTLAKHGELTHLATFVTDGPVAESNLSRFTSGYLGGYGFVSNWAVGTLRFDSNWRYKRIVPVGGLGGDTQVVPGFPDYRTDPLVAVCETNARMLYLTKTAIYWSGPGDGLDMTPALGGAGFQTLSERIAGTPVAMLPVADGVMIWTDSGVLVGEFIGGPFVFRWYQTEVETAPVSQAATVTMPDGTHLLLTKQGLMSLKGRNQQQAVSQLFNEFLREYIRLRGADNMHLWYSLPDNRVFIGILSGGSFTETLCLDLALDKWGIMSHIHRGLIQYESGSPVTGFYGIDNYLYYLIPPLEWESVCELPNGELAPLLSEVTIGYVRDENMMRDGDGIQELTDIVIYHNRAAWENYYRIVDEGFVTELDVTIVDEGELTDSLLFSVVDEGQLSDLSLLSHGYKVDFISDFNTIDAVTGVDYGSSAGFLAHRGLNSDSWTGSVHGQYISLRIKTTEPGESYRINAIDCSLAYAGQIL